MTPSFMDLGPITVSIAHLKNNNTQYRGPESRAMKGIAATINVKRLSPESNTFHQQNNTILGRPIQLINYDLRGI